MASPGVAALLREHLNLQVIGPKRLDTAGEATLTRWMRQHMYATVWPYDDRDALLERGAHDRGSSRTSGISREVRSR